jgi:two-component system response regulator
MSRNIDVLLVEDNSKEAQLTLRALSKIMVAPKVQVARDGVEALEFLLAAAEFPRLVLLDLKLPKVDGLEFLQRMRCAPHLQRIPVVVLTSSSEERDIIESYQLGANSYVVKPVNFDQLTTAVQQVADYWLNTNRAFASD